MRIPVREASRRLHELVRRIRQDHGASVHITVRGKVVAELRAAVPAEPGAAARALLEVARRLPKPRQARRTNTAERVKEYLYGRRSKDR